VIGRTNFNPADGVDGNERKTIFSTAAVGTFKEDCIPKSVPQPEVDANGRKKICCHFHNGCIERRFGYFFHKDLLSLSNKKAPKFGALLMYTNNIGITPMKSKYANQYLN
jgi:hypothetical protein